MSAPRRACPSDDGAPAREGRIEARDAAAHGALLGKVANANLAYRDALTFGKLAVDAAGPWSWRI